VKTTAWNDLNHKVSPKRREQLKREAVAELDRMGFASLRKARQQTQAELAGKLGIDQASVSAIENRSDLLLSTLAKYVRALGGDVEIRAVFPEATFNLEPLLGGEAVPAPASVSFRHPGGSQKPLGGRRRAAARSMSSSRPISRSTPKIA
jgi:transcriptional regulator with XRE-family HTH domain